jgi:hypothetical protein
MLSLVGLSLLISPAALAINLTTQMPNSDKREFNTNPGTSVLKPGYWYFLGEFDLSANALVMRNKTSGEITPLVKNLMGLDLGLAYGVNDWWQMGVVAPLLMSQGSQSSFLLSGPTIEAKFKILEEFALIPSYQLPLTSNLTISNPAVGYNDTIKIGAPSGSYGAKVVYQKGHVYEGWGLAGQLGYYSAPDNVHTYTSPSGQTSTIDQSSTLIMGLSGGIPLTESVNAVGEIYGAKSGDSFPIEMLGLINIRGETVNWQLGGGTGNLQGSGSNTYKAFVGLTYNFGGGSSAGYSKRYSDELEMPKVKTEKEKAKEQKELQKYQPLPDNNRPIMEEGIDGIEDSSEESIQSDSLVPEAPKAPVIPDVPTAEEEESNE